MFPHELLSLHGEITFSSLIEENGIVLVTSTTRANVFQISALISTICVFSVWKEF